jgi:hypothetical protein
MHHLHASAYLKTVLPSQNQTTYRPNILHVPQFNISDAKGIGIRGSLQEGMQIKGSLTSEHTQWHETAPTP